MVGKSGVLIRHIYQIFKTSSFMPCHGLTTYVIRSYRQGNASWVKADTFKMPITVWVSSRIVASFCSSAFMASFCLGVSWTLPARRRFSASSETIIKKLYNKKIKKNWINRIFFYSVAISTFLSSELQEFQRLVIYSNLSTSGKVNPWKRSNFWLLPQRSVALKSQDIFILQWYAKKKLLC